MQIKQKRVKVKRYDNEAYLMILPAYFIFGLFVLLPIFMVAYYSFTDYNMYQVPNVVGLRNYTKLFKDGDFLSSVKNTLVYTIYTLPIQMAIGLSLAVLLYKKSSKLVSIFRTAIYLPNAMSMVCVSMVWLWIYNPNLGLFNSILKMFNLQPQQWLLDPNMAMFSIILISVWKSCGYSMVVFLSGLTAIPSAIYEAAKLDGAGPIREFMHITWPMLRPTTFFLVTTGIVNSFAVFEQVNIMTGGGPLHRTTTVVHQIYQRGFLEFKMGYASAMAILLLIFSLTITMFVVKFGGKGQDTDVS